MSEASVINNFNKDRNLERYPHVVNEKLMSTFQTAQSIFTSIFNNFISI